MVVMEDRARGCEVVVVVANKQLKTKEFLCDLSVQRTHRKGWRNLLEWYMALGLYLGGHV